MFSLEAKIRTETAKETRVSKRTPAVVYGKDVPSTSISVDSSTFLRLYREAGQNHVVTLQFEKEEHPVLIHEVVRHPVRWEFLHIDFLVIDMKKDTEVDIPVVLVGTAPAVIEGNQIMQSLQTVTVKCKPKDIVDSFELDISSLEHVNQTLHVSDLVVDTKKHTILNNPEESIVSVHAIKGAVEEETETPTETEASATETSSEDKE